MREVRDDICCDKSAMMDLRDAIVVSSVVIVMMESPGDLNLMV
jgi:hypothetical protein